jgi:hypothetical protein
MTRKKTEAEVYNQSTYNLYDERFCNIALNMFEWSGLPEGIPDYYIEKLLYKDGIALFINDPTYGLMCLSGFPISGMNVYEEYTRFRAIGFNYNKEFTVDNCVPIWNNPLHTPTAKFIQFYSEKLMRIERSIDVNLNVVRIPWVFQGTDNTILTLKNIYGQVERNEPIVYINKNLSDEFNVHLTPSNYLCDKLSDLKHEYMNDIATFFGINNANTDKKERLITDEVQANDEFIKHNADYMLESRQKAVEKINKMFGTNISVELKIKEEIQDKQEVSDNGKLHN